jgi:hypothetical protein
MSPPTSFVLSSYAERIAEDFIRAPSPGLSDATRQRYRPTVLRFMDIEADQCDQSFDVGSPWSSISICLFHFSQHAHHLTISNDHLKKKNIYKFLYVIAILDLSKKFKEVEVWKFEWSPLHWIACAHFKLEHWSESIWQNLWRTCLRFLCQLYINCWSAFCLF